MCTYIYVYVYCIHMLAGLLGCKIWILSCEPYSATRAGNGNGNLHLYFKKLFLPHVLQYSTVQQEGLR